MDLAVELSVIRLRHLLARTEEFMHDIDRTQLEASEFEYGPGEMGESADLSPRAGETASLGELQEIELATEMLEVSSPQELEQFLGSVLSRAAQAAGTLLRSDTGRALTGILRGAARQALPVIGRGIGQWISPGQGGAIGANLARNVSSALGLELEGLTHEDREFETARQFIRFVLSAGKRAALAPRGMSPSVVARRAAWSAARTYAPGLLTRLQGRSSLMWPRRGSWVRRGRTIVLFG
jgi:hypothetical protein